VNEPPAPAPAPPQAAPPREPPVKQPFGGPRPDPAPDPTPDPQAGIDTRELSLAALQQAAQAAAARALPPEAAPAPPAVDGEAVNQQAVDEIEVDLAEAERQDAAAGPTIDPEGPDSEGQDPEGVGPAVVDPEVRSGIDPRIRERRVAVTRAEGRRRLRILLTAVSIASAIGIAWLIVQSPFLAVNTVNVRGSAQESQAAVLAAAKVKEGSALLFVDTGAVAGRVETLPWVAKATVERDLPNALTITVVERKPVAWVRRSVPPGSPDGTQGVVVLVDRFGRVLGDQPLPTPGLPELVGITRVPARGGRVEPAGPAAALAELPDALRAQTGSLVRRRSGAVLKLVALPGGAPPAAAEVRLGSLEEVGPKGAAALAVLDQLAAGGEQVRYIDVRVPGAPATR
jgi:cell division protein FtsQ